MSIDPNKVDPIEASFTPDTGDFADSIDSFFDLDAPAIAETAPNVTPTPVAEPVAPVAEEVPAYVKDTEVAPEGVIEQVQPVEDTPTETVEYVDEAGNPVNADGSPIQAPADTDPKDAQIADLKAMVAQMIASGQALAPNQAPVVDQTPVQPAPEIQDYVDEETFQEMMIDHKAFNRVMSGINVKMQTEATRQSALQINPAVEAQMQVRQVADTFFADNQDIASYTTELNGFVGQFKQMNPNKSPKEALEFAGNQVRVLYSIPKTPTKPVVKQKPKQVVQKIRRVVKAPNMRPAVPAAKTRIDQHMDDILSANY